MLGLTGFVGAIGLTWQYQLATEYRVLICASAAALPMILYDVLRLKVHERRSAGMNLERGLRRTDHGRSAVKLVGLLGTLLAVATAYGVFREYHGKFYYPFWNLLGVIAAPFFVLAYPYIVWVDRRMPEPRDGFWHVGAVLLGKWDQVERTILAKHFRGWLVKGFFLPLMVVYLGRNLDTIARRAAQSDGFVLFNAAGELVFKGFYDFGWLGMYTCDVGFAVIGYALTFRVLDAHMRSAEPTMLGWAVCLTCYQPFWGTIERQYLHYSDSYSWGAWLRDHPVIYTTWGAAILFLTFVYVWATVTFGVRFSNLTHRGVLTFGPYRFLRHPAYVSKNLSWWLISIPFIPSSGGVEALRSCITLALLNGVYAMRAWTEERHLSSIDPAYDDYRTKTPLLFVRVATALGLRRRKTPT